MSGILKKIIWIIMALALTGAILYLLWREGMFLPRWVEWRSGTFHDTSGSYGIALEHRAVKVTLGDQVIWTSPEGVKVQDVLSCDIDNDHSEELILLCWKIGRYGRHRPFWVEEDERKWSQHIFVYQYYDGEIRPEWMSSYIGQDVAVMAENGREVPAKRLLLTAPDGEMGSWKWDSWGFAKEDTDVSFVVFGDNLIHEPIYRYGLQHDEDFSFLFENMGDVIDGSDVAVINQETPFVEDPAMCSSFPRFGTPVSVGQAIVDAGFDVVTCATNHALDQGTAGINTTKGFFDSNEVVCLGIQTEGEGERQSYGLVTRKGIRFALLNYTYGTNGIPLPPENPFMVQLLDDEDRVREDIRNARAESDFVIVFVHWGTEDSAEPDGFQAKWAQVFLDSGVDVVVGTHPHVLQPYEMLRDDNGHEMLVYYSIGNYISAQTEKTCIKGGMAGFTVSLAPGGYRVSEYGLQPLAITWSEGRYTTDFAVGPPANQTD